MERAEDALETHIDIADGFTAPTEACDKGSVGFVSDTT